MLRWRILGISFCIQPSFWFMNALWAYVIYTYFPGFRDVGLFAYILIWVLCTLASVLVHELGHVVTARIFGQPGNITVTGLGGQAVGEFGELAVWQRILVICAGPGAGFLLAAALVLFDADTTRWNLLMDMLDVPGLKVRWFGVDKIDPLLRMGGSAHYAYAINILLMINLFVNVINLFPIIPMDGGMLMKEFCCLIAPRSGAKMAFAISFVLACANALFSRHRPGEVPGYFQSVRMGVPADLPGAYVDRLRVHGLSMLQQFPAAIDDRTALGVHGG